MTTVTIEALGAEISQAERAVLTDMAKIMAGIHRDRQKPDGKPPSLAEVASGLVGMLAEHDVKNSDPEAYAFLVGVAAILYLESGQTTVYQMPTPETVH